jgi:hypothetical protein
MRACVRACVRAASVGGTRAEMKQWRGIHVAVRPPARGRRAAAAVHLVALEGWQLLEPCPQRPAPVVSILSFVIRTGVT